MAGADQTGAGMPFLRVSDPRRIVSERESISYTRTTVE